VETSYTGLLERRKGLRRIDARGLRITIGANERKLPSFAGGGGDGVEIGRVRLEDAILRFESSTPGKQPLDFVIHALNLRDFGREKPIGYQVALRNAAPKGEIQAHGEIGPIGNKQLADVPASGSFRFDHADITTDHAITGILNATGEFNGPLRELVCTGKAEVPQFQVASSSHALHLQGDFRVVVDARNGDAGLTPVSVRFNQTTVVATGRVEGTQGGRGKTIILDTDIQQGRAEDLLLLFGRAPRAPFTGALAFHGRFVIPPGPQRFLTRLRFDGGFTIAQGRFTSEAARTPVNRLSASAEGTSKQEERRSSVEALARLSSSVVAREGIAHLNGVTFEVPGAAANASGTFRLRDAALDLRGNILTEGKLADTTGGVKALMLKAVGPMWKKRSSVKVIPFRISGSAPKPQFKLELTVRHHAD